nr:homeobox-leucine zipper protein HAT9-like [Ipomoea batatas]
MAEEDDQKLDLRLGLGHCSLPKEDNSPKKTSGFGVSLDLSLPLLYSNDIIESSKTFEVYGMESRNSYGTKNNNGVTKKKLRTKLKQTEVDCNLLKKYCESLNYENCRLRRELHELRSSFKFNRPAPAPFSDQPPKARTTATCPSCEKNETELVDTVLELKN